MINNAEFEKSKNTLKKVINLRTLMALLFQLGVCFGLGAGIAAAVTGTTYYVSATEGNNANPGTSSDQAWKTLTKVNSSSFQPGDKILFKRGDIWRETLIIPSSGAENTPITYDAYGSGSAPIISGADTVSGWTNYKGSIYVADASPSNVPNQLYVDGSFYDIAHYPNSGWLTATKDSTDTTSVIDSNLKVAAELIKGATIMVRAVDWQVTTSTVAEYNSAVHKIMLSGNVFNSTTTMKTGRGYYFQNKLEMLDSPGEWYYDSTSHKVYLWMKNNENPNSHTVEISNRSYCIKGYAKNYITIQNLALQNANLQNVKISSGNYVKLYNLDISGGQYGITCVGLSNSIIDANSVKNSLSSGIYLIQSSSSKNSNVTISGNAVANAGYIGESPKTSYSSIHVSGTRMTIDGNTVTNSGRNGIAFWNSQNIVKNNYIDGSCLASNDCAGIYTSLPNESAEISGNTIKNIMGNIDGTFKTRTSAVGIYLDDLCHDIIVHNNTVDNADNGIFIHTGHSNTVTGNTVQKARRIGMLINRNTSGAPSGSVYGNIIKENTFESLGTQGSAVYYDVIGSDDPARFGAFDNNRYYHPNSNFAVESQHIGYTLSDWQKLSGQDLNSVDFSSSYSPSDPSP